MPPAPCLPEAFASARQAQESEALIQAERARLEKLCASAALHRLADAFASHPQVLGFLLSPDPEGGYMMDLILARAPDEAAGKPSSLIERVAGLSCEADNAVAAKNPDLGARLDQEWLALDAMHSEFSAIFHRFSEEAPSRFREVLLDQNAHRFHASSNPLVLARELRLFDIGVAIEAAALREGLPEGSARAAPTL